MSTAEPVTDGPRLYGHLRPAPDGWAAVKTGEFRTRRSGFPTRGGAEQWLRSNPTPIPIAAAKADAVTATTTPTSAS